MYGAKVSRRGIHHQPSCFQPRPGILRLSKNALGHSATALHPARPDPGSTRCPGLYEQPHPAGTLVPMASIQVKAASPSAVRSDLVALVTEYVSTWGGAREPLGEVEWNIVHSLVSNPPSYLEGWVAYVDKNPVGTVLVTPGPAAGLVEMSRLFVLPEYRKQGIARALLAELHAWAERTGAPAIYLFVQTKRAAARELYASLGYEEAVMFPREKFTEMLRVSKNTPDHQ